MVDDDAAADDSDEQEPDVGRGRLTGRVCVITGAASVIGGAAAWG